MKTRTLLIASGAALAGIAVQHARSDEPAPPVARAATVERTRAPAARIASPEGIRVDVAEVAHAAGPAAARDQLSPAEARARDDRRIAAFAATLATQFASDARDPQWSPQAEQALRDQFAAAKLAGARLDEAACGATLCRVAVTFDSLAHLHDGYNNVIELVTWGSRGFGDASAEDPLRYVYYASRDRKNFPALPD